MTVAIDVTFDDRCPFLVLISKLGAMLRKIPCINPVERVARDRTVGVEVRHINRIVLAMRRIGNSFAAPSGLLPILENTNTSAPVTVTNISAIAANNPVFPVTTI